VGGLECDDGHHCFGDDGKASVVMNGWKCVLVSDLAPIGIRESL
jgi:hypothetical protein